MAEKPRAPLVEHEPGRRRNRMKIALNKVLLAYTVVMTTALAGVLASTAIGSSGKTAYDEIDVKRLNVREENGTLRMVISNTERFPGLIFKGKEHPHPNRKTAGMLFFNEEGTENGGLIFDGKTENGRVSGGGHLSFDQYEQDQVVQITHAEEAGERWAALVVSDRPDAPMDLDAWEKAEAMPEGAAKQAEMKRLQDLFGGKRRLFVGKSRDRSSGLALHDAAGRPRMRLMVSAEGAASIQFLDENGKTVRTVTPTGEGTSR
jgi:hypothetical protein